MSGKGQVGARSTRGRALRGRARSTPSSTSRDGNRNHASRQLSGMPLMASAVGDFLDLDPVADPGAGRREASTRPDSVTEFAASKVLRLTNRLVDTLGWKMLK